MSYRPGPRLFAWEIEGFALSDTIQAIPGFPGYYATRDGGIVSTKNRKHSRLLRQHPTPNGYLSVCLSINGRKITKKVHTLILSAFSYPWGRRMQCDHINGNRHDNRIANLRWLSARGNVRAAVKRLKENTGRSRRPRRKMCDHDAADIICLFQMGLSASAVAALSGFRAERAVKVKSGKLWPDLPRPAEWPKRKTCCAKNANAKLSMADVLSIRAMRNSGAQLQRIADKFGIAVSTTYRICSGEQWKISTAGKPAALRKRGMGGFHD